MPKAKMPEPPWRKMGSGRPRRAPRPKIEKYPTSPPRATYKSNMKLAAVDPGITTGMAFRVNGQLITFVGYSEEEVLDAIKDMDFVVIERFATAGRLSAPGLITIELVGAIKGWLRAHGVPYELATPQARNAFMSDAKKEEGRLIEKSRVSRHEVDALAHLLAWEYRNANH